MTESNQTPPPPPPGWGTPPAQPWPTPPAKKPKKPLLRRPLFWVVVVVLVLIGSAIASGGSKSDNGGTANTGGSTKSGTNAFGGGTTKHPAVDDVDVSSCEHDSDLNSETAHLTITNHSSQSSNYILHVEFVDDSGTRLGDNYGATNGLAPGQAAKVDVVDVLSATPTGTITCKLIDVQRLGA